MRDLDYRPSQGYQYEAEVHIDDPQSELPYHWSVTRTEPTGITANVGRGHESSEGRAFEAAQRAANLDRDAVDFGTKYREV